LRQIVLDTNVLVAALRSRRGASYQLVRLIGQGNWRLNISVALALEYEDVLKRKRLLPAISESEVDEFLDYLFMASNLIPCCAEGQVCLILTTSVSWKLRFSAAL
jgi:predicted nucleic acid-binding protein